MYLHILTSHFNVLRSDEPTHQLSPHCYLPLLTNDAMLFIHFHTDFIHEIRTENCCLPSFSVCDVTTNLLLWSFVFFKLCEGSMFPVYLTLPALSRYVRLASPMLYSESLIALNFPFDALLFNTRTLSNNSVHS